VLALGEEGDPVERIISKASTVVLDAMQAGWSGPPFDPFALAEYLKISTVPREQVPDARVVATPDGKFQIEFNPNRPKGRMRYSIAHEVAHTLFENCGEAVRNRLAPHEMKGDDWQLEMFCNIVAAEFLMPTGSFPDLRERATDIDHLMSLRSTYDVSTEALLLRVVRTTDQPCAVIAASRRESSGSAHRYQIDYSVPSRAWPKKLASGTLLPEGAVLGECTAIGYTAKRDEQWPAPVGRVNVQCVGIPPYPSKSYPRVIGMIRPLEGEQTKSAGLTFLKGNALEPRGTGQKIIAHVVNDRAALWGAGFGLAMRKKWPRVQEEFRNWVLKNPGSFRLGDVFSSPVDNNTLALQMICQHGYGPSVKPRIRYSALQSCLEKLARLAIETKSSIHMPRIGAGQGGGAWQLIEQLIDETLCGKGVEVTVYDLPGGPIMVGSKQIGLFDKKETT